MDAQAYLRKHGWRGDGHSLDQSGRGIKRPLLVSKKVDVLGVGLNKHAAVSDQWWLRAFDNGLKNFGTGQGSMLASVQKHGVNRGGLYGRFVEGEGVASTFEKPVIDIDQVTASIVADMATQAPANTASQGPDRKRKHVEEAVDMEAHKQQKLMALSEQRQDNVDQAAKALVAEAVARGIIPAGKQKQRATATDPNDPLCEMIKSTSYSEHARVFDTGDPKSAEYKAAHDQVKREFEEAAKKYLLGAAQPENALESASKKTKSKKNASLVDASTSGQHAKAPQLSRKAIAAQERATRRQNQVVRRAARIERRKDNMNATVASKSAKGERLTVREAATACGIRYKQYTIKATGKAYSDYVKDNEKAPVNLDDWVELHRKSYPELELASQPVKDYVEFIQANGLKPRIGSAFMSVPDVHGDNVTERDQIDAYYAKKSGLSFEEYRSKLKNGALEEPSVDLSNIDAVKLAEYQDRASAKGIELAAYVARRENKYAAKQGEKLIKSGFQVHSAVSGSNQGRAAQKSVLPGGSAVQYDPVAEAASWISIADPSTEPPRQQTNGVRKLNAAIVRKTAKKEKKAAKKERKAAKKLERAAKTGIIPTRGKQGKKAGKGEKWSAMMAKRAEKKKKKLVKRNAKVAAGDRTR